MKLRDVIGRLDYLDSILRDTIGPKDVPEYEI